MALVNYATREINAKIVYYGPGLSGKTTNIQHVFEKVKPANRGKLIALATQGDRTLFFDFLPVELGNIKGFRTRFHLYTVPGQVFYNSTRKLVLKGTDGIVFVADSQKMMVDENIQSMENLRANLADMGIKFEEFPIVIQYNKRDLPSAAPVEDMNQYLNPMGLPYFEAVAINGDGVLPTLTAIVKYILHDLKHDPAGHNIDFEAFETRDEPAQVQETAASEPAPEPEPVKAEEVTEPLLQVPYIGAAGASVEGYAEVDRNDETPGDMEEMPVLVSPSGEDAETLPDVSSVLSGLDDISEIEVFEAVEVEGLAGTISDDITWPEEPPVNSLSDAPLSEEEKSFFASLAEEEVRQEVENETPVEAPPEEALAVKAPEPAPAPVSEAPAGEKTRPVVEDEVPEGPKAVRTLLLPVRLTTKDGPKEVMLKLQVDVELLSGGLDSISKVEVMLPVTKEPAQPADRVTDGSKLKPPELPRPKQPAMPMPKPKLKEKKRSMFQKILGIR